MKITNQQIYKDASIILKKVYAKQSQNPAFRKGQYEAIEATLTRKRVLVVQKTGWGKSLVYFISTKINRQQGRGVTLIISPLLALMENQIDAARNMDLKCGVLNSMVNDVNTRKEIMHNLSENEYDLFFITPESLFGDEFQEAVGGMDIGLFVIDECHCISDWGHDFRLEYGNLHKIIDILPENVPVLGTTATANDRVIEDLAKQFGKDVFISRGSLTRDSLHIEILPQESKALRYAWLGKNIPILPGSGIIYCLTRRDCRQLSDFLNQKGLNTMPYYSDGQLDEQNKLAEEKLMKNDIKALVSTIKLGMCYDKPDISFVVHYQQPGSVIAYYQQIGRAGRNISNAYCYLMTGQEDDQILEYFIETAFPTKEQALSIVVALQENSGLTISRTESICNMRRSKIEQFLSFLENEGYVYRKARTYFRSAKVFTYNGDHYDEIKKAKRAEKETMQRYLLTEACLSKYIVSALNDESAYDCGKCRNCLGDRIFAGIQQPNDDEINAAQEYLNSLYIPIEPRKRWPARNMLDIKTIISHQNETGLAIAKYGDAGYGEMVAHDKYKADRYREALVAKSVAILTQIAAKLGIEAITIVPSYRNRKLNMFAEEVAKRLGLLYLELFSKSESPQQKNMENAYFQAKNIIESMSIKDGAIVPKRVILIDDVVDSKWTLTVCGWLLMNASADIVYPFCLADSGEIKGYN